jgi:hypothetical protein
MFCNSFSANNTRHAGRSNVRPAGGKPALNYFETD